MATIQSQLKLNDGMTSVLRSITTALDTCLSSFEQMQAASGQAMDVTGIAAARAELFAANSTLDEMEGNTVQMRKAQHGYNDAVKAGHSEVDTLLSKVKGLLAAAGAGMGIQKILGLSDDMAGLNARLSLVVDDGGSVADLEAKIFASAQRARASYQTTADTVAKLRMQTGDAFSDNDELIAFAEQLNKSFVIAGAEGGQIESVMYNLTQALSTGVLRGQDFNSVLQNAQPIVQHIADYMGITVGELREMATEGAITADVVKNAMFAAAEQTNATFEQIPMTWGQLWTVTSNAVLMALQPLIQWIGSIAGWIHDNWSTIAPVFYGIAAAIGVLAAAFAIWKIVTIAQTIAQWALNSALLANPITWIVLAIAAVVMGIVMWINKIGGLEIAWKYVVHGLLTAWDWVKIGFFTGVYWVLDLWDKMKLGMMTAGVGIANFMGDMKVNVLMILQNMVNGAIDIINGFIGILNKIPGVNIGLVEQVTFGTTAQLENEAEKQARNNGLAAYRSDIEAGIAEREASLQNMKDTAAANATARLDEIHALQAANATGDSSGGAPAPEALPYEQTLNGIEENTGSTASSLKNMSEDLVYMRDLAEREAINRYTTAELKIDMPISNRIDNSMDLDGVMRQMVDGLTEAIVTTAEGVHK